MDLPSYGALGVGGTVHIVCQDQARKSFKERVSLNEESEIYEVSWTLQLMMVVGLMVLELVASLIEK